ncbi:erythromycin esterase family protein [Sorangium sp. So ce385]|uniref:erythromycin esterase family protein n=1 Tax=Sorangium sp. So ce385 TaxID=3133308 RepID=UPI003F5B51D9
MIDGLVKGPTGAPVAGALVAAVREGAPTEAAIVRSAADGAFCFEGLAPGDYGLTITSADATSAYVDVFAADGASKGHAIDVRLGGGGFTLRGRLTDQRGNAAGKRVVRLARLSNFAADLFVTESAADGSYAVKLPPATYHLEVAADALVARTGSVQLDRDRTADLVLTPQNPRDRPPPEEVVAWLQQKAIPIATPEAGHGFADLEPLRAIVGDARVVALGEATHGTREFFQVKHRMLEFLVEQMGFRAFAIEANFPEALVVDEYVRTGKGDPYAAVSAMRFWTWETEEVVEMVRWMRRYNEDKAHKEKLRFFGFDMQFPAASAQAVADALGAIDKELWSEVAAALEPIDDDFSAARFDEIPAAEQEAAAAAAAKVAQRFDEPRDADVKKLGEERFSLARIHAHVLADFGEMSRKRASASSVRDRAMGANALRLMDMLGPKSKMVVWAHNGHVQRRPGPMPMSMGRVLADRLGKDLVVFGFAFDRGSFQALQLDKEPRGLRDFTVGAAPPGSLDGALARAGVPAFALDLRAATGPAATWLHTPTTSRTIGSVFSTDDQEPFKVEPPAEMFDALFFFSQTTAARSTPNGKRPRKDRSSRPALANGGFEEGTAGAAPLEWQVDASPRNLVYRAKLVTDRPAGGKLAVQIDRAPTPVPAPFGAGSFMERIDARPLRGKRVRFSAKTRLEGKGVGDEAFVAIIADGGAKRRTSSKQVSASKAWRETAVEVDVAPDVESLAVGMVVTGTAKATVDDAAFSVVTPSQ